MEKKVLQAKGGGPPKRKRWCTIENVTQRLGQTIYEECLCDLIAVTFLVIQPVGKIEKEG